ncbi:hypothetical protein B5F24_13115 [Bacteroides clarus]|uniref:Uncharacterized protein n=1 Tax=Bacteroides clarus TaxID=626929 RepID=A0A1Y4JJW8_9BACE|nr:hypothetical protein [Bacteroides clarus]OUP32828.1 hypothetical protein B5F24_13115 [Bacteroides clarus]
MGEFFGSIYCWFEEFFGIELANYLWGESSLLSQTNSFIGIGWSMFGISFAMTLIYYYVINHPQLNHWWGWIIFLVINGIINFIVGWQWVLKDYYDGKMITIDPATNLQMPLNIGESEIIYFGVSNMFISVIAFIVFSFILKWWSTNCSRAPF